MVALSFGDQRLAIGDRVDDLKVTIEALKVAALEHKRRVFLAGNGGDYRRVQCVVNDCPFFVRFKQTPLKTWRVVNMEPAHVPECATKPKLTPKWVSRHSKFKIVLDASPSALPVDVARAFNAAADCNITKETAYKAMCIARKADAENKKRAYEGDVTSATDRVVRAKASDCVPPERRTPVDAASVEPTASLAISPPSFTDTIAPEALAKANVAVLDESLPDLLDLLPHDEDILENDVYNFVIIDRVEITAGGNLNE